MDNDLATERVIMIDMEIKTSLSFLKLLEASTLLISSITGCTFHCLPLLSDSPDWAALYSLKTLL
ncbi:hypothetical protein EON65_06705 [archaeon]|nr:MAG: hypothetical protein EON65_06705 [archaeon]